MSHIIEDRVLESTTTTGTGALALSGAVTGFRRFSDVCGVGDTVPYFIEALDSLGMPSGDYEYGTGTYSAANTLTRTTVEGSSNAGAAVNFSAGTKNVGLGLNASGFAVSWGATDVIKFPNGAMIQTGGGVTNATPGTGVVIAFPTPFVGTPKVNATNKTTSVGGLTLYAGAATSNNFTIAASVASIALDWIAVGRWK